MTAPVPKLNQAVCPDCRRPVAMHQPEIPLGRPRYRCPQHGEVAPLRRVALFPTGAWEVQCSE